MHWSQTYLFFFLLEGMGSGEGEWGSGEGEGWGSEGVLMYSFLHVCELWDSGKNNANRALMFFLLCRVFLGWAFDHTERLTGGGEAGEFSLHKYLSHYSGLKNHTRKDEDISIDLYC